MGQWCVGHFHNQCHSLLCGSKLTRISIDEYIQCFIWMNACPHEAVVVSMVLCESGFSLIDTRTCILHIIRHLVDLLKNCIWDERHWLLEKKTFHWFGLDGACFLEIFASGVWKRLPNNNNIYMRDTSIHHSRPLPPNTDTSSRSDSLVTVWYYSTPTGSPEEANLLDIYD